MQQPTNEQHVKRVMRGVAAATGIGVFIVVVTFILWRGGMVEERVSGLLFLGATLLITSSVIFVAGTIPYMPGVTPLLVTGAVLVMVGMVLEVLDDYDFTIQFPVLGRDGALYMPHADDALVYSGLGLIVCCAYLAILDAALGRFRLMAESEEKTLAIQEAQRYAQALARSERVARDQLAEIHNLYHSAPAGLCYVDRKLRCQRVNTYFSRLDGVAVREHIGQHLTAAVPLVGEQLAVWCSDALRTGVTKYNAELSFDAPDTRDETRAPVARTWLVSIIPVMHGPAIGGVQLVVQDITDVRSGEEARRELAVQVHQAQKARSLGVLAAGVAHDFNNLLTGILGNASLLIRQEELGPHARRLAEAIVQNAERSAELTGQMLAYAGHAAMEARPVTIDVLITEAMPLLSEAVGGRGDFVIETDAADATVLGDGTQLRQAVLNLVTNAGEALGQAGGVVSLRSGTRVCGPADLAGKAGYESAAPGEYVFIEVSDNGCGMEEATISAVFDPFYSTKFAGRGLGLAVVLGVCRHHKGVIDVVSAPGKGSRFTMLIPVIDLRDTAAVTPVAHAVEGTVVLIVDDEEAVRAVAEEIVADLGYAPVTAADGRESIQRFLEHRDRVGAVLLDLTMPGMDGRATFQALRAEGCTAPILVLSGYTEDQVTHEGVRDFDYYRFLQKPFTYDGLSHALRDALESRG